MRRSQGSVCTPLGFFVGGCYAGIRQNSGLVDLAVIHSLVPASSAYLVRGFPKPTPGCILTRDRLHNGLLQTFIVNGGNHNRGNGPRAISDVLEICGHMARSIRVNEELVTMINLGEKGFPLPMRQIRNGISTLAKNISFNCDTELLQTLMNATQEYPATHSIEVEIEGYPIRLGGVLQEIITKSKQKEYTFIVTSDVGINPSTLEILLSSIEKELSSFFLGSSLRVFIMANGQAFNREISSFEEDSYHELHHHLCHFLSHLTGTFIKNIEGF